MPLYKTQTSCSSEWDVCVFMLYLFICENVQCSLFQYRIYLLAYCLHSYVCGMALNLFNIL